MMDTTQAVIGEEVPVIRATPALDSAYRTGYGAGQKLDSVTGYRASDDAETDAERLLRREAGFEDVAGNKTFERDRLVVVLQDGDEEHAPAYGEAMKAGDVYDVLLDAFDTGALDAVEGRPPRPIEVTDAVTPIVGGR